MRWTRTDWSTSIIYRVRVRAKAGFGQSYTSQKMKGSDMTDSDDELQNAFFIRGKDGSCKFRELQLLKIMFKDFIIAQLTHETHEGGPKKRCIR